MNQTSSNYFTSVQQHLDSMGQSVTLTADERDIVDDFATQEFSADACAIHIMRNRR